MKQKYPVGTQIFLLLLFISSGLAIVGPLFYVLFLAISGNTPTNIEDIEALGPLFSYASAFFGLAGIFLMAFVAFLRLTKQKVKKVIFFSKFQLKFLAISIGGLIVLYFASDLLYLVNKAAIELIPNSGFAELELEQNERYGKLFSAENKSYFPIALFVFAVVPAFVEELVFRGLLLVRLKEVSDNKHFGVIVSSMLFAAFHFQPWNILPMIGLATLFGYVYLYTKDIRYSMLMHFLYNAVQMTLMFFVPDVIN